MSGFSKGVGAFIRGFNKPDEYNSQDIEYEITSLKNKIASTKVNHILHLILSIITMGIWIIIWILIVISASSARREYEKLLKKEYQKKEKITKQAHDKNIPEQPKENSHMNATEKLINLSNMLEKGLITEEEFKTQKEAILS